MITYRSHSWLLCVLLVVFCSCGEKQYQIIIPESYTEINDIIAIADCSSPFGDYLTEVRSKGDGSCVFIQKFNNTDAPFIVRLDGINTGYVVNEQDVVTDTLSREDVEMIRGHEIHKMSITPGFFFNTINFEKQTDYRGSTHEQYSAKDGLDNPVSILYHPEGERITKIELRNPMDIQQSIEILFNAWTETKYGELANDVSIVQAQKDTFNFYFKSLKIYDTSGNKTSYK